MRLRKVWLERDRPVETRQRLLGALQLLQRIPAVVVRLGKSGSSAIALS